MDGPNAASPPAAGEAEGSPAEMVAAALRAAEEQLERLGRELPEIEILEQQTRGEAARHEQRRAQAADRLTAVQSGNDAESAELTEAVSQLVMLTRRSAMMKSQVDVLIGKQKALTRFRDHLTTLTAALTTASGWVPADLSHDDATGSHPAPGWRLARDPRRAGGHPARHRPCHARRAAQSLANIMLQAQIVERLVSSDPEAALREASALVTVVLHALDATKTFIFNVRPWSSTTSGSCPRFDGWRATGDTRPAVPIEFESTAWIGVSRPTSRAGLFRVVDEATGFFASREPSRIKVTLTWEPASLAACVQAATWRRPCSCWRRPGTPGRAGPGGEGSARTGRRSAPGTRGDDPRATGGRRGSPGAPAACRAGPPSGGLARHRAARALAEHRARLGDERRRVDVTLALPS